MTATTICSQGHNPAGPSVARLPTHPRRPAIRAGPDGGRAIVARPLSRRASRVRHEGDRPPAGPVGGPASCRPPATATATAAADGDAELVRLAAAGAGLPARR